MGKAGVAAADHEDAGGGFEEGFKVRAELWPGSVPVEEAVRGGKTRVPELFTRVALPVENVRARLSFALRNILRVELGLAI